MKYIGCYASEKTYIDIVLLAPTYKELFRWRAEDECSIFYLKLNEEGTGKPLKTLKLLDELPLVDPSTWNERL